MIYFTQRMNTHKEEYIIQMINNSDIGVPFRGSKPNKNYNQTKNIIGKK